MTDIVLIGSGGHAKSVIDVIESCGEYRIIGFLELPNKKGYCYKGYGVIGTDDDAEEVYRSGITTAFITMGYMGKENSREKIYNLLRKIGFRIPNIIDKSAIVASNVLIPESSGIFIGKRSIINANSTIGEMTIVNTGVIIEHDCKIGKFVHLAVGSVLCGGVTAEDKCFIGANSTIIQGVRVGNSAIIGAGAVVLSDVQPEKIAVGTPAYIKRNRGVK